MLDSILHHTSANARSSAKRVDSVMILVLSMRVLVSAPISFLHGGCCEIGNGGSVGCVRREQRGTRGGSGGGTSQADDGPHHVSSLPRSCPGTVILWRSVLATASIRYCWYARGVPLEPAVDVKLMWRRC